MILKQNRNSGLPFVSNKTFCDDFQKNFKITACPLPVIPLKFTNEPSQSETKKIMSFFFKH
jgi:hypothetical protein